LTTFFDLLQNSKKYNLSFFFPCGEFHFGTQMKSRRYRERRKEWVQRTRLRSIR